MERHPEYQYLDLLAQVLDHGDPRIDRTGVGTQSIFGAMARFDVGTAIPMLTTKRVFWKTAVKEMLWFLTGGTNIQSLLKQNVRIWTDWPFDKYKKATGDGPQSVTAAIFWLKTRAGWKETFIQETAGEVKHTFVVRLPEAVRDVSEWQSRHVPLAIR